ncbi:uncharacterized protein PG998_012919 [Apiospora kogelbergensis]|uniref:uncharacterized protein n=1 Tax=Apiospora kogelbergensis TaxID=1337665 RepID=UPI00312CCE66
MVTPACYSTSSETSRRYSRACPPYPLGYLDRRYSHHHLPSSHHDTRFSKTMVERDSDDAPRKRIAVACGRCRKRKIRCSGDPGNGGPCSNCKNAGHEPCLFLRVSSTETHLRDGSADYGYNVETARAYHARSSGGALSPLSTYGAVMSADAYRQNAYPGYATSGKAGGAYYSTWTGAGGAYPDDGVSAADYGLGGYPGYPTTLGQGDPVEQLYRYNTSSSSSKAAAASVYVDPAEAAAASTYPYGSLVHRPAAAVNSSSSELPNFSLSSMAASLPSSSQNSHSSSGGAAASERLPNPHRTLSSSSSSLSAYRAADGLPAAAAAGGPGSPYASGKTAAAEGGGGGGAYSDFDSPASYGTGGGTSRSAAAGHYAAAGEYGGAADSYVHTDASAASRRGSSQPGGGGGPLANGHDYVPVSHANHPHAGVYAHPNMAPSSSSSSAHAHAHAHAHDQGTSHHDLSHHHHQHYASHRSQQQQQQAEEYDVGADGTTTGAGATSSGRSGRHHLRGH